MKARMSYETVTPGAIQALGHVEYYVRHSGLETSLLELVRLRASEINGCACCVDMHTKDARAAGETEQRLYAVSVWNDTRFFTERERAGLAWTEAVTRISETRVPDDVYQSARQQFSEKELVDLTMTIIAINGWNRSIGELSKRGGHISAGARPGSATKPKAAATPTQK